MVRLGKTKSQIIIIIPTQRDLIFRRLVNQIRCISNHIYAIENKDTGALCFLCKYVKVVILLLIMKTQNFDAL